MTGLIVREGLSTEPLRPTSVRLRTELDRLETTLDGLRTGDEVGAEVAALNHRVLAYVHTPSGPPVRLGVVDVEEAVRGWTARRPARPRPGRRSTPGVPAPCPGVEHVFEHCHAWDGQRVVDGEVPGGSAMPFRWTVNTLRGCTHACVYCFARNTHTYLDLDAGADFDGQVVVRVNAAEVPARQLRAPSRAREHVAMGTNTDPYQRAEGRYALVPGVIDAAPDAHPVLLPHQGHAAAPRPAGARRAQARDRPAPRASGRGRARRR